MYVRLVVGENRTPRGILRRDTLKTPSVYPDDVLPDKYLTEYNKDESTQREQTANEINKLRNVIREGECFNQK